MLYITSIARHLETLILEEVKDFIVKNFKECFKSTKEECILG